MLGSRFVKDVMMAGLDKQWSNNDKKGQRWMGGDFISNDIKSDGIRGHWSNTGQILVKYWSNTADDLRATTASARPAPARPISA